MELKAVGCAAVQCTKSPKSVNVIVLAFEDGSTRIVCEYIGDDGTTCKVASRVWRCIFSAGSAQRTAGQ